MVASKNVVSLSYPTTLGGSGDTDDLLENTQMPYDGRITQRNFPLGKNRPAKRLVHLLSMEETFSFEDGRAALQAVNLQPSVYEDAFRFFVDYARFFTWEDTVIFLCDDDGALSAFSVTGSDSGDAMLELLDPSIRFPSGSLLAGVKKLSALEMAVEAAKLPPGGILGE